MQLALLGLFAIIPFFIGYCRYRDSVIEDRFAKVVNGMTRDQVVAIMGAPTVEGRCGIYGQGWDNGPPGCVRELGYSGMLAPSNFLYCVVWFGPNGRVKDSFEFGGF